MSLVHIGDQSTGPATGFTRCRNQRLGQRCGRIHGLHERATAQLDIQHQSLRSGGQFFAQDRGGNQINAVHRTGDIADRIEPPIRRGDAAGGGNDSRANIGDDLPELGLAYVGLASSLSSVPPVWPRPRPETIGT